MNRARSNQRFFEVKLGRVIRMDATQQSGLVIRHISSGNQVLMEWSIGVHS